ncbi:MAG: hypothetical protein ABIP63_05035 [Thermoanaerobaculia bacterium]
MDAAAWVRKLHHSGDAGCPPSVDGVVRRHPYRRTIVARTDLESSMRKLLAVLIFFAAARVSGASPFVRVLVPLYLEQTVPGMYGAIWKSEFAIHNGSGRSFIIETCFPLANSGCILNLMADEELLPNETQTALPARYPKLTDGAAGAVVYLLPHGDSPADDSNKLSFQIRVKDLSRSATNAGTEVPVVRESAFRTSTLHLLNVSVDPRFRVLLRLFEMNLDRAEFSVRVFDQATNVLLSELRVTTSTPPQGYLRSRPGFAQIANLTPSLGIASQPMQLRVEVEPLTAGSAFWSYLSVTNNESQQVTLVTPQ